MADWYATSTGYPEPDDLVEVRLHGGKEVKAKLRLFDESTWPDGSYWETEGEGARIELVDVAAWRRL